MEYQNLAETEAMPGPGATGLYDAEGNVSDGSVDDYGYDWGDPVLYPKSARSAGCGNTRSYAGGSSGSTGDEDCGCSTEPDDCIENQPAQSDEAAYEIVVP